MSTEPFQVHKTNRGFRRAKFEDRNRISCSIQESSHAEHDFLWLGIHAEYRMLLSREHVRSLLPLLRHFCETGCLPDIASETLGNCPDLVAEEERDAALAREAALRELLGEVESKYGGVENHPEDCAGDEDGCGCDCEWGDLIARIRIALAAQPHAAAPALAVDPPPVPTVTVCSACLQASCWQGWFLCNLSGNDTPVEKTRAELEALDLEHPSWWDIDPQTGCAAARRLRAGHSSATTASQATCAGPDAPPLPAGCTCGDRHPMPGYCEGYEFGFELGREGLLEALRGFLRLHETGCLPEDKKDILYPVTRNDYLMDNDYLMVLEVIGWTRIRETNVGWVGAPPGNPLSDLTPIPDPYCPAHAASIRAAMINQRWRLRTCDDTYAHWVECGGIGCDDPRGDVFVKAEEEPDPIRRECIATIRAAAAAIKASGWQVPDHWQPGGQAEESRAVAAAPTHDDDRHLAAERPAETPPPDLAAEQGLRMAMERAAAFLERQVKFLRSEVRAERALRSVADECLTEWEREANQWRRRARRWRERADRRRVLLARGVEVVRQVVDAPICGCCDRYTDRDHPHAPDCEAAAFLRDAEAAGVAADA